MKGNTIISLRREPKAQKRSILIPLQFIIIGTAALSFIVTTDHIFSDSSVFREPDTTVARSLAASKPVLQETSERMSSYSYDSNILDHELEVHLNASMVKQSGHDRVRQYYLDPEPLRHLRFSDLLLPDIPPRTPVMKTAFQESTVVTQAPWFPHNKICKGTCCAQAMAISLEQDDTRIINAVDGQDMADLLLYGHTPPPFHEFAATELTHNVLPCLRPGVIIHADSYRGPITRFFEEYRPNMTVPYVFITSKTDGPTPIEFYKSRLDTDPLLKAWYGINPSYKTAANHTKFRAMPLGLTGNKFRQQPDLDLLMKARNYTNPFAGDKSRWTDPSLWENVTDTTPLLFVKFGLHINALHREIPFNMACQNRTMAPLDEITCNMDKGTNPRQTYDAASKYPFGLSPPGNGKDCFRTYELLLNGVIPIVLSQPENELLFHDLPILQLNHWKYNQTELIQLMKNFVYSPSFLNNTFDAGWKRLFLRHWRRKILENAGRLHEIVTDDQGKEYYTAWVYTSYKRPHIQHATPEYLKKLPDLVKEKERKDTEKKKKR